MWTLLGPVEIRDERTNRALRDSLFDGVFATVMLALVDTFGVAGAVTLQVHPMAIALLSTLPAWLGTLMQALLLATRQSARPRKPAVLVGVRLQALWLVALGVSGWLPRAWTPWAYVVAFALQGMSGAAPGHLWMSWFADLCPARVQGRHGAWRNAVFACVQLAVALTAGVLTRRHSAASSPWSVFFAVFATAGVARGLSSVMLARQYEPPVRPGRVEGGFGAPRHFLHFAVAIALFQSAAVMAGPFFSVWFLRDLRFSYLTFALGSAATVAGNMFASPIAGRLADRVGSARVLRVSAWLAAVVPLPYLVCSSPAAVWAANFYSGAAWAGVNVAAFKVLLSTARGQPSQSAVVLANLWLTTCSVLFSVLGGWLATRLPIWFSWRLQSLFFLSCLLRLAIAALLVSRVSDTAPESLSGLGPGRIFQLFRWKGPGTSQV